VSGPQSGQIQRYEYFTSNWFLWVYSSTRCFHCSWRKRGGANSSLNEQDDQRQTRPQPGLSKIIDMLNKQKQPINSVVPTQKELEKTVNLLAGVKKEMSGLSVLLEDISHNYGATNKTNRLPKPVMVSGSFVRLHV